LIAVPEWKYKDIPGSKAQKGLLEWSPKKPMGVLEEYLLNPQNSILAKWGASHIN
jgi:hypothetical protein